MPGCTQANTRALMDILVSERRAAAALVLAEFDSVEQACFDCLSPDPDRAGSILWPWIQAGTDRWGFIPETLPFRKQERRAFLASLFDSRKAGSRTPLPYDHEFRTRMDRPTPLSAFELLRICASAIVLASATKGRFVAFHILAILATILSGTVSAISANDGISVMDASFSTMEAFFSFSPAMLPHYLQGGLSAWGVLMGTRLRPAWREAANFSALRACEGSERTAELAEAAERAIEAADLGFHGRTAGQAAAALARSALAEHEQAPRLPGTSPEGCLRDRLAERIIASKRTENLLAACEATRIRQACAEPTASGQASTSL